MFFLPLFVTVISTKRSSITYFDDFYNMILHYISSRHISCGFVTVRSQQLNRPFFTKSTNTQCLCERINFFKTKIFFLRGGGQI